MSEQRYVSVRQHEPLRIPQNWTGQDRQLVIQLDRILDDIYRRFKKIEKIGIDDLDDELQEQLEGYDEAVEDLGDLTEFVGDTSMGTTATTVTGAIAEHEGDIVAQSGAIANLQGGIAYIVGNTNTTGVTLAVGQFVYVKGHSTISEGLYKVTASISTNGSITTSNTSACSGGGLNELNNKMTLEIGAYTSTIAQSITSGWSSIPNDAYPTLIQVKATGGAVMGFITKYSNSYGSGVLTRYDGEYIGVSINNGTVTVEELALNSKLYSKITNLYSGDDLNNIRGDGVNHLYYIGSGVTNSPLDYAIMIIGSREGNTGLCSQIVVGTDVYSRVFIGSPPSWSPWNKLSLKNDLANYSSADATKVGNYWTSGLIRAHRRGYVVTLKLDNMAINSISGRTQIATIPDGYRPVTEVAFYDDGNTRRFIVSADGAFKAETQSAGNMWGAITYVCNK